MLLLLTDDILKLMVSNCDEPARLVVRKGCQRLEVIVTDNRTWAHLDGWASLLRTMQTIQTNGGDDDVALWPRRIASFVRIRLDALDLAALYEYGEQQSNNGPPNRGLRWLIATDHIERLEIELLPPTEEWEPLPFGTPECSGWNIEIPPRQPVDHHAYNLGSELSFPDAVW